MARAAGSLVPISGLLVCKRRPIQFLTFHEESSVPLCSGSKKLRSVITVEKTRKDPKRCEKSGAKGMRTLLRGRDVPRSGTWRCGHKEGTGAGKNLWFDLLLSGSIWFSLVLFTSR